MTKLAQAAALSLRRAVCVAVGKMLPGSLTGYHFLLSRSAATASVDLGSELWPWSQKPDCFLPPPHPPHNQASADAKDCKIGNV